MQQHNELKRKNATFEDEFHYLESHKRNRINPIELTIKNWLHHSKQNDIKYNRYNPEKFVTKEYLEHLVETIGFECYYCMEEVQYDTFGGNQATLERNYNEEGHNVDNVTIACHTCNIKHVGQKEYE
jgi:hypothetical protein